MRLSTRLASVLPTAVKQAIKRKVLAASFVRPFHFPDVRIIQSPERTLTKCQELMAQRVPGTYCRFGDGEVNLANGKSGRSQRVDQSLRAEMRAVMSLRSPGVLKALAIHSDLFGYEPHMRYGVHKWSDEKAKALLYACYEYFIGSEIYSAVALHYTIVYQPEVAIDFLGHVGLHRPIFVGSEQNDPNIVRRAFGADEIVTTPSTNAYARIDEIETQILERIDGRGKEYVVVVTACGAMGKALTGRLLRKRQNVFIVDVGSVVEVFHGRTKWSWVRLSGKDAADWDLLLSQIEDRRTLLSSLPATR